MRIKLEWQEREIWHSAMAKVAVSRNGNWTFKHDGKVYVFKEKREGEPVLVLDGGKWVRVGRVTHSLVFLGKGTSSDEYYRIPEGMKAAEEALRSFLTNREMESHFSDNSQAIELRALVPPEFNSHCSKCGLLKKFLPWHASFIDGSWGAVCDNCARPFLIRLLRRRLPPMFSEGESLKALCGVGLGKKESELILQDFEKEGIFWKTEKGFQWLEEPSVIPISGLAKAREARKRAYRRLSGEEIFIRCVRLSREILKEEKRRHDTSNI